MNKNRKTSAILGWMIGDALGTTLEFKNHLEAKQILSKYSNFVEGLVGKGPFHCVPGQFTDDTEMGLAIMSILNKYGYYHQEKVANKYHQWYQSYPKDIGNTIRNTVQYSTANKMINAAKKFNSQSLSNGFLMRLPPLIVFYSNEPPEKLITVIKLDIKLTHSHPEAEYIALVYGLMLKKAILGYSANEVYQFGSHLSGPKSDLLTNLFYCVAKNRDYFEYQNQRYTLETIGESNIGFVGYAFWLLLLSLRKFTSYHHCILWIVSLGGDTDTNACIVGAVMGALYPESIPIKWINSVLNYQDSVRFKNYPLANPKVWKKWII